MRVRCVEWRFVDVLVRLLEHPQLVRVALDLAQLAYSELSSTIQWIILVSQVMG